MIPGFFHDGALAAGDLQLDSAASAHVRVRRLDVGDPVRITNGSGGLGQGTIASVTKRACVVTLERVHEVERPGVLELVVPVADRDRMLLAAEKCAELQVTAWRPALFARSRSVNPRGEGDKFREKLRARMISALEQSGGAWLPTIHEESELGAALAAVPESAHRVFLDAAGAPIAQFIWNGPMGLAVGPEGGLEPEELRVVERANWTLASLAPSVLRFETAVIAGAAVIRAAQLPPRRT